MSDTPQKRDAYLVLARKYRPRKFDELYGQEALVQTLSNAIEAGRLHHAYILNGVRGIGKTTTARILAKVLNCENGPSVTWKDDDPEAKAIEEGRHVDVLEFDAASHTGVDEIKELFEGVHYAPVQGKYKVYIIDEVHMLSKQAFNALLKTLEEPPEYVKFIFATTEINKMPVTVISRCQRFDLRRITADTLVKLFTDILAKENIEIEEAAVHMIARAADGSARDGLSLLDQSIALSAGKKVTEALVSHMLGMADRALVYDLFDGVMHGQSDVALEKLNHMHNSGHDPLLLIRDLLYVAHLVTKLKVVPSMRTSNELSQLEKERGGALADSLGMENLSRVYQMLLTTAEEAKKADNPFQAVEMGLIRALHLAPLPAIATLIEQVKGAGGSVPSAAISPAAEDTAGLKKPKALERTEQPLPAAQPEGTPETVAQPEEADDEVDVTDWRALARAIRKARPSIGTMLEHQVRPVSLTHDKLILDVSDGLYKAEELTRALVDSIVQVVGRRLEVELRSGSTEETVNEAKTREAQERVDAAKQHRDVKKILDTFPAAQVVTVRIEND